MFMSHEQNAGKNHSIKTANKSFRNMAKFVYFGIKLMYQNCMHE
jgi:hypothetical protein